MGEVLLGCRARLLAGTPWLLACLPACLPAALNGPAPSTHNFSPRPLHCLQRIGSVDNVGPFLEGVKNRKERMFGFGHRCAGLAGWLKGLAGWERATLDRHRQGLLSVPISLVLKPPLPPHPSWFPLESRIYKNYDPRARIIRQVAEEVFQIAGGWVAGGGGGRCWRWLAGLVWFAGHC